MKTTMNDIEIEGKVLDIGHKDLEEKIFELGGEKVSEKELTAVWLQCEETKKKVRVRLEGDTVSVEYKEKRQKEDSEGQLKEMTEIGFTTDNFENTLKVFNALGFKELNRSVKTRVSYIIENEDLGKITLDFDKYSKLDGMKLPEFLELEGNKEAIYAYAEKFGIAREDILDWDAGELAAYYRNIQTNQK